MSTVLILVALVGTPTWLWQFYRARPSIEQRERAVDPLTGALFFGGQAQAREGLAD